MRSAGKGRAFWEYNLANLERATNALPGEELLRREAPSQVNLW